MIKKITIIIFAVFTLCLLAIYACHAYAKIGVIGIAIENEVEELPLLVQGEFPHWLRGSLVRNSSIPVYQDGRQVSHDFDGLAMLHRFGFENGRVFYTNQFLRSQAYDSVINHHIVAYEGFASNASLWDRLKKNIFFNTIELCYQCFCKCF